MKSIVKNRWFRVITLIGIVGNIGVGISYLLTNNWLNGIIHIFGGCVIIPMFIDSKEYSK
jgi:hypothetical protein